MTFRALALAQLVLSSPQFDSSTGGVFAAAIASTPHFRHLDDHDPLQDVHGDVVAPHGDESFAQTVVDGDESREAPSAEEKHIRRGPESYSNSDDYRSDDYRRRTREMDPRRAPVGFEHDAVHRVAGHMPEIGDRAVVGPYGDTHFPDREVESEDDADQHNEPSAMLEKRTERGEKAAHAGDSSLSEKAAQSQEQAGIMGDMLGLAKEIHSVLYTRISELDYPYMCQCNYVDFGARRLQKQPPEGKCITVPKDACGTQCIGQCKPVNRDSAGAVSLVALVVGLVAWF